MLHLFWGFSLCAIGAAMIGVARPAPDGTPARFLPRSEVVFFYAATAVACLEAGTVFFVSGVVSVLGYA